MAVIWGTPTPATILVVQIEPGPTPILTASQPASIRASHPSSVAMFPADELGSLESALDVPYRLYNVSRVAVGSVDDDDIAACLEEGVDPCFPVGSDPTAAPTRSRPRESLQAPGYLMTFSMSFMVMRPFRL